MPAKYTLPTLREHARTYSLAGVGYVWRRLLARSTRFVAISGSNGKTTAKDALSRILARRGPIVRTEGTANSGPRTAELMLRVRPRHYAAVAEMGISRPNQLGKYSRLYAPDVAVLTRVSLEHRENIGSIENIAREKSSLLKGLRPGGTAVLNADDPFVSKMRPPEGRKTIWFGRGPNADVRASEIYAAWPETLRFRVRMGDETAEIHTKLVGEHWIYSLAAAIAAASAMGVPLAESAAALDGFEPHPNRLEPVSLPNGAVLWRDDGLATLPTLEVGLEALRRADVERRWLMTADASFLEEDPIERREAIARWVAPKVDAAIFVGEHSDRAEAAAREAGLKTVRHFETVREAARFVREELGEGDLVLLKAHRTSKLARVAFLLGGEIDCALLECQMKVRCDSCPDLGFRPNPDAPKNLQWRPKG